MASIEQEEGDILFKFLSDVRVGSVPASILLLLFFGLFGQSQGEQCFIDSGGYWESQFGIKTVMYLMKVANKENFLKTLDPPGSISNSELHTQKEDLIKNKSRIQRFLFFFEDNCNMLFRMTDKMTSFNETWSTTMENVNRSQAVMKKLSAIKLKNKEATSAIIGETQ